MQSNVKTKETKRGRPYGIHTPLRRFKHHLPVFEYDIALLRRRRLEKGLSAKGVGLRVIAIFGNEAPKVRTVQDILGGYRRFPAPKDIRMIADVLGVPMTDLVIENTCPAPDGELAARPQPGGRA